MATLLSEIGRVKFVLDPEYPVALKRCANVAKFNSRRYLPLDSTYFPSTSSLFVLPNKRTIGMKTCNMSIEEHNLSFWTSFTAKNINLKNVLKNQLELPEKSAFRVMVTFDNQESAAGVYYFFVNGIQSKPKYPDSVLLRNTVDERKATFELPAIRPVNSQPLLFVSDSRKYRSTFLGFKFDKDVVYELKHQIKWTSFQRKGNSFISFQVTVNNQSDYESENSEEDDPLDLHVYISDEKHVHTKKCRYYRLLVFPTEIPTFRIHPKPAGNETNHTVSYEVKVNRAKWLVDQLYIFPALGKSGTKCVKEQNCQDLVIFDSSKKGKGKKKSIFLEVTLLAHDIENLTDYAIFVMDPGKRRFQIYQFDSSSRYSPATAPIGTEDPPVTYTTTTPVSSAGFGNEWAFLLMIPFGIATGAFFLVLYVRRRRVHFGKVSADTADQAAFETSQRRFSDGYEVLPGDRVSGDYEHIVEDRSYEHLVEDRRLSHGYEAILCQDFPRNNLRDASSNVYQTISLENVECLPQATKPFSKMNGASLKHSLSCSNITFAHAGDTRIYVEDDSELFFKSHSVTGHRNANKEQLALKYFMLRNSTDDARCVNPFYTTDVKETRENIELQDSSTRRRCSANADGECEYLTVLDSSDDDGNYLELIPD
ncbi:hypothetical protein PoB_003523700 [Plakobranchus ocellatus]|uniref:CUB domain-containing protein n=1 Tax=Plakobranchus ocellatus TaxID=259542 RepID=A0AAV4AP79_9GAST|nr:hypothetical protein PoB_003523700 [Plakobranchus ocellatus]